MKADAMQDYVFCGVGLQSMTDGDTTVVPVVVLEPAPTCEFWPEPKFTIAAGSFQAGQTVDPSTLKQQVIIDFTDKDDDIATVDFKNPGTFDNLIFSSSSRCRTSTIQILVPTHSPFSQSRHVASFHLNSISLLLNHEPSYPR